MWSIDGYPKRDLAIRREAPWVSVDSQEFVHWECQDDLKLWKAEKRHGLSDIRHQLAAYRRKEPKQVKRRHARESRVKASSLRFSIWNLP